MNIGGGEAADQLVRMMLSGSEVAVRLSGSAIKNVLALTMALAKKHKTISGKVNLAKMLKEKNTNISIMGRSMVPLRSSISNSGSGQENRRSCSLPSVIRITREKSWM